MSAASHPLIWEKDRDGREQLRSTLYYDPFFSSEGGREECGHVFINGNQLPSRWSDMGLGQVKGQVKGQFTIAELGFGTGLNFLETWRQWIKLRGEGQHLHFVSFEGFPLPYDDFSRAQEVWPQLSGLAVELKSKWQALSDVPQIWQMDEQTSLEIIVAPIEAGLEAWQGAADAWYLDGFSPSKNPEMWSENVMRLVAKRTNAGGTVSSYTSAGWVRRNLELSGFNIERVQGFGKKRHMIAGKLRAGN